MCSYAYEVLTTEYIITYVETSRLLLTHRAGCQRTATAETQICFSSLFVHVFCFEDAVVGMAVQCAIIWLITRTYTCIGTLQ